MGDLEAVIRVKHGGPLRCCGQEARRGRAVTAEAGVRARGCHAKTKHQPGVGGAGAGHGVRDGSPEDPGESERRAPHAERGCDRKQTIASRLKCQNQIANLKSRATNNRRSHHAQGSIGIISSHKHLKA